MKKKITFLIGMVFSLSAYAQTGINSKSPNANLEVVASTDNAKADGIIFPKVTKASLITKTGAYAAPQTAAVVYVTDATASSTDAKFTNIDDIGYYYFDGAVWQKMKMVPAPIQKWDLNGNAITDGQFLGTTNTQTLQFKYNSFNAGFLNDKNTSYGVDALPNTSTVTGTGNIAVGISVLKANTSGNNNVGFGTGALVSNTTGNDNIGIGYNALNVNSVGISNVAIGTNTLSKNTGANANNNTAVGSNALANNTTNGNNTAVGSGALTANTVGNQNTAVGNNALALNVSSNGSTAVGTGALSKNTFQSNTAVGTNALANNTTGSPNTAIGFSAAPANTTGSNNVAVGESGLKSNTTGSRNIGIGSSALGQSNVASDIVAIGNSAFLTLKNVAGNDFNTALGSGSGKVIVTGTNNTMIGGNSGSSSNTILSNSSTLGANTVVDASNASAIGASAVATATYATAIGSGASAGQANTVILGRNAGQDFVGIGTNTPTHALHIKSATTTTSPLKIENVQGPPSGTYSFLLIGADGIVYKSVGTSYTQAALAPTLSNDTMMATITRQAEQIKQLTESLAQLKTAINNLSPVYTAQNNTKIEK